MRLSWPFNFFQRKPDGSLTPAGEPPVPALAPAVETARRPGGRNEWRELPALTETIGPAPLIAPNAPFAADLGAGSPPPPVLRPLAHGRGLDAPAGIVVGLARPVQRTPDGSPRPLVQRRAAPATTVASGTPEMADDGPLPGPADPPSPSIPITIAPSPARPSLARLSARDEAKLPLPKPGVVGQPITSAAPASAGRAVPVPISQPAQPGPTTSAKPALPDGSITRKPADAPSDAPASLDLPVRTRPTLGQSRRLGLGAPLATPLATSPEAPSGAGVAADAPLDRVTPIATAPAPEPTFELRRTEPVQRRPADDATGTGPVAEPAPARPASAPVAAPMPMAAPSRRHESPRTPPVAASAPLVSARPIGARVQRAPLSGGHRVQRRADAEIDEALPAVAPQPVRIHRGANAGDMAQQLEAKAFTHNGEVYLPPSAGPLGSSGARSLLAHELTHVAQQRQYGSRLPQETSALGQRLEAAAVAAERRAQLPLAMPAEHSAPEPSLPAADLSATAQRRPQTAGETHTADETTTITFPGTQRAPAGRGEPDVKTGTRDAARSLRPSDREMEELASRLYGRISRRLRRELLVDRERAGLMVDLP